MVLKVLSWVTMSLHLCLSSSLKTLVRSSEVPAAVLVPAEGVELGVLLPHGAHLGVAHALLDVPHLGLAVAAPVDQHGLDGLLV